ncbi:ATP-grasp domain-containing protein [Kitasatospora sp. NE20-6]|uniref:ATP-grasp domain-containing protein n=1 Tax=Kitasatospora sp. NE20-6 TaxID=2859066 RepID=UPI0038B2EAE6
MTSPAVLLPLDPLAVRRPRPDPHFLPEAEAVREAGGTWRLLDHDALLAGDAEAAVRLLPEGCGPLWYRGWMVGVASYHALAGALAARGGTLQTSPADYARAHELPGWYEVFAGATPATRWLPGAGLPGRAALVGAARLLGSGPAVVKDYVKSRKHEWHEACFVPELTDADALCRVVARFVELQGDDLAGGVVLRRFEDFVQRSDGGGPAQAVEARVWWLDGEPVLVGPHPDVPGDVPAPDLSAVRPLVSALGCRFVTTDVAQRAGDGEWRVVEVGDGQVSGLPRTADPTALLTALLSAPAR